MRRVFSLMSPFLSGIALAAVACDGTPPSAFERSLTSTVALQGESLLVTNVPLPIVFEGERRNDIIFTVDLTVTASSSTLARTVAESIEITELREARSLELGIIEPDRGRLSGTIRVRLPRDLDLVVTERAGTVDVFEVTGSIKVNSLSHVRITGAENDLFVAVEAGNALVDSDLPPSKTTTIRTGTGDIELKGPPGMSTQIQAETQEGDIVIAHPALPRWPGGNLPYRAQVNGGLHQISILAGQGTIVVTSR